MRRKPDLAVIFAHYLKLISRTLTKPTLGCKVFSRIPQHSPSEWTPHVIPKPQYSHGGSHLSLLHPRPLIFFCSLLPLAHPHAGVPGKLPSERPLAGALSQASSLGRGPSMGNLGAGVLPCERVGTGAPRRGERPRERRRRRVPGERWPGRAPRRASRPREHRRGPPSSSSSQSRVPMPDYPKSGGLAAYQTRVVQIRPLCRYCCSSSWFGSPRKRRLAYQRRRPQLS
jgi:hypothetical protein